MSDGRDKPSSVDAFFNQSPEFYAMLNSQAQPGPIPKAHEHASGHHPHKAHHEGEKHKKDHKPGKKHPNKTAAPLADNPQAGVKVDLNETQELNSMLNILGIQLAPDTQASVNEEDKDFISKKILLLENGELHLYCKESQGQYFGSSQSFGEKLVRAAIDKQGKFVAVLGEDSVSVLVRDEVGDKLLLHWSVSVEAPKELWFSQTGRYLSVYSKRTSKNGSKLLDLLTKTVVYEDSFEGVIQPEHFPLYKFTFQDALVFSHQFPDTINVILPQQGFKIVQTYKTEPFDYMLVTSTQDKVQLALITKHNEANAVKRSGKLVLINYPDLDKPVLEHSFQRAHELKVEWCPYSDNILIQACDFIDETGRSYYGKNTLYLYIAKTGIFKTVLTYAGPIHSFCWFPKDGRFMVQSGFMPAHTVVYSPQGDPQLQLGVHHRNTLRWSPLNRFLLVGGFENLKGEIDIWDMIEMVQVGQCISHHASLVEWAPDGRHFLTAIVEQTLRVSNEVNIFKYDGTLIEKFRCPLNKLNAALWIPTAQLFVDRPSSPKPSRQDKGSDSTPGDKKKKMNLKWDSEADPFHRTEGMKTLTSADIVDFNNRYDQELKDKIQKEAVAAEKFEKKQQKLAESGKGDVVVKTPTVLKRGGLNREQLIEQDKERERQKEQNKDKERENKQQQQQKANNAKDNQSKNEEESKGSQTDRTQGTQESSTNKKKQDKKNNPNNQNKQNQGQNQAQQNTPDGANPDEPEKPAKKEKQKQPKKQNQQNQQNQGQQTQTQQNQPNQNIQQVPKPMLQQPPPMMAHFQQFPQQFPNFTAPPGLQPPPQQQQPKEKKKKQQPQQQQLPQQVLPQQFTSFEDFENQYFPQQAFEPQFQPFQGNPYPMYYPDYHHPEPVYIKPPPGMFGPYQGERFMPVGQYGQPYYNPQMPQMPHMYYPVPLGHQMPYQEREPELLLGEQLIKQMLNIDRPPQNTPPPQKRKPINPPQNPNPQGGQPPMPRQNPN